MRHVYIRLFVGVVWLLGAAVALCTGALPLAALDLFLGIAFLLSARSMWKKGKHRP